MDITSIEFLSITKKITQLSVQSS